MRTALIRIEKTCSGTEINIRIVDETEKERDKPYLEYWQQPSTGITFGHVLVNNDTELFSHPILSDYLIDLII